MPVFFEINVTAAFAIAFPFSSAITPLSEALMFCAAAIPYINARINTTGGKILFLMLGISASLLGWLMAGRPRATPCPYLRESAFRKRFPAGCKKTTQSAKGSKGQRRRRKNRNYDCLRPFAPLILWPLVLFRSLFITSFLSVNAAFEVLDDVFACAQRESHD